MKPVFPLDANQYKKHAIHGENRIWTETNCYTDIIIELLHSMGHEPIAALSFTLATDFEGDQWTFFKFPHEDLFELYGLEIKELNPWRPSLLTAIEEQLERGNPVLVELDSYFLPDTAGTAYKTAHVKTTVAVNEINREKFSMGYFHNQGYYTLNDQDFVNIFQLNGLVHDRMLPPYVEFVKRNFEKFERYQPKLIDTSLNLLKKHLDRSPKQNPFITFKERFKKDEEWLMNADMATFHTYSFANLRQYGACFELTETYLRWLSDNGYTDVNSAADSFKFIAETAKTFQFQLARAMARKKPLDLSPLDAMATQWASAMNELKRRFR